MSSSFSSGQVKIISSPPRSPGVEVTHNDFYKGRVFGGSSSPSSSSPPRTPPRQSSLPPSSSSSPSSVIKHPTSRSRSSSNLWKSGGAKHKHSSSPSSAQSVRSSSSTPNPTTTTAGGRGPKSMAKRLGHILSPRGLRGNRSSSSNRSTNGSVGGHSAASLSVISDNATTQSIEGQQSVARTVDSHDTVKISNIKYKVQKQTPKKTKTPAPSSSSSPRGPVSSSNSVGGDEQAMASTSAPIKNNRPRGWQKLKRLVAGGRPPTTPAIASTPPSSGGAPPTHRRVHSKSYDAASMAPPTPHFHSDRPQRSRIESHDRAADRKAASARSLSSRERTHLDLAIRGRLDGVDVLFLGPARRSPFPLPASDTTTSPSSSPQKRLEQYPIKLAKNPLTTVDSSSSPSSSTQLSPQSSSPETQNLLDTGDEPEIDIDPLKLSFTGFPITYTAAELVSDMVWTSAGRDKPELIFEGFIPGGGDRWCVKLEENVEPSNPLETGVTPQGNNESSSLSSPPRRKGGLLDDEWQERNAPVGSPAIKLTLQGTFDDESTAALTMDTTTDDGSTNLPTQKLWDHMWGSDKAPPPIPSHMQMGGSFDVSDDDSRDNDILQLAAACSVPIDLDEDTFIIDGPDHLRSVHDLAMVPIQRRRFDTALSILNKLLRGLQQPGNTKLEHLVGVAHHNIGLIHMCEGSFGDALEQFKLAVEIRVQCLPPNHPDIVVSLVRQGMAYLALESYEDAVTTFETALGMTPAENATRAKILNNLGTTHFLLQDLEAALKGFTGALEIQRQWLDGPVRREPIIYDAAVSLGNMGKVYMAMNDYNLAFYVLEEACLLQMTCFRKDHHIVLSTLGSMALVKALNGNYEKASQIFESIRRSQEARFGPEHQETIETIGMLAYVQIKKVDFDEALEGLKTVNRWQLTNLPPSHPAIRMTKNTVVAIEKCIKGTTSVWI